MHTLPSCLCRCTLLQMGIERWKKITLLNVNHIFSELWDLLWNFNFFNYCTGGTMWHWQKFLQYLIMECTPSIILLYSPLISGRVSRGLIFPFPNMCSYFHHIHLPMPFISSRFHWCLPYPVPDKTCFAFLFSIFLKKKKKDTFLCLW
jgi:hypothetical protein